MTAYERNSNYVISFLTLRKLVGILGMALPFALLLGFFLFEKGCRFPPSISHFYYTNTGNLFVGTLCAVALFLFTYNGYDKRDMIAAKLAGAFALIVAMFPTNFGNYTPDECNRITTGINNFANAMHYGGAVLLFSTFAYFSLVLFTKSSQEGKIHGQKLIRNYIYKTCGWVIVVCIVLIALIGVIDSWYQAVKHLKPTYVLETIALLAFGYSWLIKGETFFKDEDAVK